MWNIWVFGHVFCTRWVLNLKSITITLLPIHALHSNLWWFVKWWHFQFIVYNFILPDKALNCHRTLCDHTTALRWYSPGWKHRMYVTLTTHWQCDYWGRFVSRVAAGVTSSGNVRDNSLGNASRIHHQWSLQENICEKLKDWVRG